MEEQKKTEEQLRHDIRRKFNFSETKDKERIDGFLEMQKDNYKTRQKLKANVDPKGKQKEPEGTQKEADKPNYTLKEIRALNNVHDEDVDRVEKWAKAEGVSIDEALKDKDLQIILKNREEERKTAQAANIGGGKRGTSEVSDEKIIADAEAGKEVDPEKLAEARLNQRAKK